MYSRERSVLGSSAIRFWVRRIQFVCLSSSICCFKSAISATTMKGQLELAEKKKNKDHKMKNEKVNKAKP